MASKSTIEKLIEKEIDLSGLKLDPEQQDILKTGGIPALNSIQKKKGKELLQSNKNTNTK